MKNPGASPISKNCVSEEVKKAVVEMVLEDPSLGQKRVSDVLRKRKIFVLRLEFEAFG